MFVAGLPADGERYLARPDADPLRDGFGYSQVALHLSAQELQELTAKLRELLLPYFEQPLSPERRRLLLSTVLTPTDG